MDYSIQEARVRSIISLTNISVPISSLRCQASNSISTASVYQSLSILSVPCAPDNMRSDSLSDTWIVISWDNGDYCVQRRQTVTGFYSIIYLNETEGSNLGLQIEQNMIHFTYNISGLLSDTVYNVRVI